MFCLNSFISFLDLFRAVAANLGKWILVFVVDHGVLSIGIDVGTNSHFVVQIYLLAKVGLVGSFPATKHRLLLWHTLAINLRCSLVLMYQLNWTIEVFGDSWNCNLLLLAWVQLRVLHHVLWWKCIRKITVVIINVDVVSACYRKDIVGFIISLSNCDVFKIPMCRWSLHWKLICLNDFLNLILHPTRTIDILLQILKCSSDCDKAILRLPVLHLQLIIFQIWVLLSQFDNLQTLGRHLKNLENNELWLFHFVKFLDYVWKNVDVSLQLWIKDTL